jgi:hypothetical protein
LPEQRSMRITAKDVARNLGFKDDPKADPSKEFNRIIQGTPGFTTYSVEEFLATLEERSLPEHMKQLGWEFTSDFWCPGSGSNIPETAWPPCVAETGPQGTPTTLAEWRKRLHDSQQVAARLQMRIIPREFEEKSAGLEIWCRMRAAEGVGGDCYRVRTIRDGGYRIHLGDVCGHGWPAALVVQELHGLMRALEMNALSPDKICAELDEKLRDDDLQTGSDADNPTTRWATLICADLDPVSQTLSYANAGHPEPLVVRKTGTVERLHSQGPPIGLVAGSRYRCDRISLLPGDRIVFFTDGIVESAANISQSDLEQLVVDNRELSASEIGRRVLELVDPTGSPRRDDMTLNCDCGRSDVIGFRSEARSDPSRIICSCGRSSDIKAPATSSKTRASVQRRVRRNSSLIAGLGRAKAMRVPSISMAATTNARSPSPTPSTRANPTRSITRPAGGSEESCDRAATIASRSVPRIRQPSR